MLNIHFRSTMDRFNQINLIVNVNVKCETLFKEETTSLVSDFHVGPPYKNLKN